MWTPGDMDGAIATLLTLEVPCRGGDNALLCGVTAPCIGLGYRWMKVAMYVYIYICRVGSIPAGCCLRCVTSDTIPVSCGWYVKSEQRWARGN